jgi:hypothetical protein
VDGQLVISSASEMPNQRTGRVKNTRPAAPKELQKEIPITHMYEGRRNNHPRAEKLDKKENPFRYPQIFIPIRQDGQQGT